MAAYAQLGRQKDPRDMTTAGTGMDINVAAVTATVAERERWAAWLRDRIEYLEGIHRTEYLNGSLDAYSSALHVLGSET